MTIIYLYIVISQQTSIHLRILNYEKLQTLDVINCTKNAKILHVSWQTGCIYIHSSETHTFSLLCLSPAEICRGRNMSHNTISCAYSNCRQGHRYIHKNKPKRGKGNRKKKKTINNEQALNGIYFRDGYHAKVLVSWCNKHGSLLNSLHFLTERSNFRQTITGWFPLRTYQ